MWIMLNNAYLSIVDPVAAYSGGGKTGHKLLVRARFQGDIERVFPSAKVKRTPERDYLFRATIDRQIVSTAIAAAINEIDYLNFKGSVREGWRHDDYAKVWGVMNTAQSRQDRAGLRQRQYDESPKAGQRQFSRGVVNREFDDHDGGDF